MDGQSGVTLGDYVVWGAVALFAAFSSIAGALALKRSRDLAVVSRRAGLSYSVSDPFASDRIAFELFRQGDGREVHDVMWRNGDDRRTRAFDFEWWDLHRDAQGHETRMVRHSSCAMAYIGGAWPPIHIAPEGLGDRFVTAVVGGGDIDFESEEFNRMFVVRCDDRRFANAFLDAGLIDWLTGTKGELSFEVKGRWLLVWTRRVKPQLLPGLLGVAEQFCEQIPDVVWELFPSDFVDADWRPLGVEDEELLALQRQVLADSDELDPWSRLSASPFAALGHHAEHPDEPVVEYDLDGDPITPRQENPWRDLPEESPDPG